MIVSRFLLLGSLLGAAACGGEEPAPPAAALPSADTASTALPGAVPADSGAALPPGLAPVAVDDADRSTADRADAGTPAHAAPTTRPGGTQAPAPASETAGPQEDEGADVLRRASAAYENVRSMQADFVMRFDNPLLRQRTTSRGTLYQQRPDRIALRFTDPEGDVILGDGEHFYVYQPSIDPNQATQTPASAGGGGGVDLQAQFVGNPTQRFRYALEGTEIVEDRPATVMTLVPRQRAEYRSLKVWFDARDSLARRFEITEHNGSIRRFDLSDVHVNAPIPAGIFRFTPPANVRIVRVG